AKIGSMEGRDTSTPIRTRAGEFRASRGACSLRLQSSKIKSWRSDLVKTQDIPILYRRGKNTPDRRMLDSITREFSWDASQNGRDQERWETLLAREWLVTNGLGGYASGTVSGAPTRRFHGVLIAALPSPHGRTMMLNHVSEQVLLAGGELIDFGGEETSTGISNFRAV